MLKRLVLLKLNNLLILKYFIQDAEDHDRSPSKVSMHSNLLDDDYYDNNDNDDYCDDNDDFSDDN